MANNKKSVLLYCDIIHTVIELSDEEAGKLFKHYLKYVNDQNPEPEDRLTALLFEPIKQNLKRDLKKWESKSLKNRENAKMRWDKNNANECERIKTDANHADKVIVTVTDTVKDKVKEINKIENWFEDLKNSSHIELIARNNSLTVEQVRDMTKDFKPKMNLDYPTFNDMANHFKNYVAANPPKKIKNTKGSIENNVW